MAKDFNVILGEAQQIKNEIIEGANTANRLGTCLEDIVQRAEVDEAAAAKNTTEIVAGDGRNGGGTIAQSRTLSVGATDDSVIVGADGIKVDTQDSLTSTSATKPLSAKQGKALQDNKADKSRKVNAGAGLTGGGDLVADRTIDVVSANDGITVNADNIQLNTIDNVTSTSATKPLSANQGKVLNEKVAQVETDLNQKGNRMFLDNEELSKNILGVEVDFEFSSMVLNQITMNNSGKFIVISVTFDDSSTEIFSISSSDSAQGYSYLSKTQTWKTITILVKYSDVININGLTELFNRTAITKLNNAIEILQSKFDGSGYLDTNGGVRSASNYVHTTDYIIINQINALSLHLVAGAYVVLYNADKARVGSFTTGSTELINLAGFNSKISGIQNVYYARFSKGTGYVADYVTYIGGRLDLKIAELEVDVLSMNAKVDGAVDGTDELMKEIEGEQYGIVVNQGSYTYIVKDGVNRTFLAGEKVSILWGNYSGTVVAAQAVFKDIAGTTIQTINLTPGIDRDIVVVQYDSALLRFSIGANSGDSANFTILLSEGLINRITLLEYVSLQKWDKKTISIIGDSIVYGVGDDGGSGGWVRRLASYLGSTIVKNCGIGGSTIGGATGSSGANGYMPIWGRIGTDYSTWIGYSYASESVKADCPNRIIDTNSDLILIAAGVNDFGQSIPIGTFLSTDTATFKGALNQMFLNIFSTFPSKEVAFILFFICNSQTFGAIAFNSFLFIFFFL